MTSDRRFDRDLPDLLAELAPRATPDYRDDIVQQTALMRQRPAWTFPERWLPVSVITTHAFAAPPVRWRVVGLVALLLLALVVGLVIFAGSQRHAPPPPFGPAANGVVAYEKSGDIYTVDPVTGASTAVISGPEADINPRWSRDGTRLAFERKVDGDSGPGVLYVARADGSNAVMLNTSPLNIDSYSFSPDGTELLISYGTGAGFPKILLAATDGSGFRDIGLSMPAASAAWRPPDGSEILFTGVDTGNDCCAIKAVDAKTGRIRTILGIDPSGLSRGFAQWSPDGSLISFAAWDGAGEGLTVQTHIIAADGTGERILPSPTGTKWQGTESWSNDGTRMLVIRGYAPDSAGARPVAIPVDGSSTGVEIELPGVVNAVNPVAWEWAPDDSLILGATGDDGAHLDQVLLDPIAGTSRSLPWSSVSLPSWQRIAP
jgi:Tol biopolymer transport system component